MIVLISGATSGAIYGVLNLVFVEPYLDDAIELENQKNVREDMQQKDIDDLQEQNDSYRYWQKSGLVQSSVILGMSIASLFGIGYVFLYRTIPGSNDVKKAFVLSGVMWFVLFFVPFLKYPASLPGIGDPDTVNFRILFYLLFIILSGVFALCFYKLSKKYSERNKITKFVIFVVGYGVSVSVLFFVMPYYDMDESSISYETVYNFRVTTGFIMSVFWFVLPLIFGIMWNRFKPDRMRTASM
jgi:predicted cobalt transporter CbtA